MKNLLKNIPYFASVAVLETLQATTLMHHITRNGVYYDVYTTQSNEILACAEENSNDVYFLSGAFADESAVFKQMYTELCEEINNGLSYAQWCEDEQNCEPFRVMNSLYVVYRDSDVAPFVGCAIDGEELVRCETSDDVAHFLVTEILNQ